MINIMIVGVGGQGSLLASRIFGKYYTDAGLDVKVSEVHGMSQRGGSVVTYVRAGERTDSPLIEKGEADIIIAFEMLEALRWTPYLKKGGTVIYSTQRIDPMPVVIGAAEYPAGIPEKISEAASFTAPLDALSLSVGAGSAKAANVVMIGRAAKVIGGDKKDWLAAVSASVPPKFEQLNITAFEAGYTAL